MGRRGRREGLRVRPRCGSGPQIGECLRQPSQVLLGDPGREVDVAGRGHRRGVQLAGIPPDDDVLDAEAVERLDDLERVEAPGVQPGTLAFFRARRATETAARSLATRVAW